MKSLTQCAALCGVALLVIGCRKDDPVQVSTAPRPPTATEAPGPSLSGMSRKQREAHRILATVQHLERGLSALSALDQEGQVAWASGAKPDMAAIAAKLTKIRDATAKTLADDGQQYFKESQPMLEETLTGMNALAGQATLPADAAGSAVLAEALISATDEMDTTTLSREKALNEQPAGGN